jgi:hypothetical protein
MLQRSKGEDNRAPFWLQTILGRRHWRVARDTLLGVTAAKYSGIETVIEVIRRGSHDFFFTVKVYIYFLCKNPLARLS